MGTEYITDAELLAFGTACARGTTAQRNASRTAASAIADSYLRARYSLPLLAWDDAIKAKVAAVAAAHLLRTIGWNPEDPANVSIMRDAASAEQWLAKVGARDVHPDVTESGAVVFAPVALSDTPRGWDD